MGYRHAVTYYQALDGIRPWCICWQMNIENILRDMTQIQRNSNYCTVHFNEILEENTQNLILILPLSSLAFLLILSAPLPPFPSPLSPLLYFLLLPPLLISFPLLGTKCSFSCRISKYCNPELQLWTLRKFRDKGLFQVSQGQKSENSPFLVNE